MDNKGGGGFKDYVVCSEGKKTMQAYGYGKEHLSAHGVKGPTESAQPQRSEYEYNK